MVVLAFNHGMEGLSPWLERLVGSLPDAFTLKFFASRDADGRMQAQQKAEDLSQRHRKS